MICFTGQREVWLHHIITLIKPKCCFLRQTHFKGFLGNGFNNHSKWVKVPKSGSVCMLPRKKVLKYLGYKFIYLLIKYKWSQFKQIGSLSVYPGPHWWLPFASASIWRVFWGYLVWLVSRLSARFFEPCNWCCALLQLQVLYLTPKDFKWIEIMGHPSYFLIPWSPCRLCVVFAWWAGAPWSFFTVFKKQCFYVPLRHFCTNWPKILGLH